MKASSLFQSDNKGIQYKKEIFTMFMKFKEIDAKLIFI